MVTKIFNFSFFVPVQRDHVVVVTRVEHEPSQTIANVVVDQTAGVTYCSDVLHRPLWSEEAALDDAVALLARQGWTVQGSQMGRVLAVLVARDEGEGIRTRVRMTPVSSTEPYR